MRRRHLGREGPSIVRSVSAALCAAFLIAVLLSGSGCVDRSSAGDDSREVIRLAGDGCCVATLQALAEAYPERDSVRFEFVSSVACGDGVDAVRDGDVDLAAIDTPAPTGEAAALLRYTPLSRDHLAVAVHSSAGVGQLTADELNGIFTGRYDNWSQLGGANLPIIVLDSAEGAAAKVALRRCYLGDQSVTGRAVTMYSEEDIALGVRKTIGSVGCLSAGYARVVGLSSEIVPVVEPNGDVDFPESDYSSTRIVGIVYSSGARGVVRDFIEWASGAQAAGVLEEEGFEAATPRAEQ